MSLKSSHSRVPLTDASVVGLRCHEGVKPVLCLFKEVIQNLNQGGDCHLQRRGHMKTSHEKEKRNFTKFGTYCCVQFDDKPHVCGGHSEVLQDGSTERQQVEKCLMVPLINNNTWIICIFGFKYDKNRDSFISYCA